MEGLLMPFINQSPVFVEGFECGQIWEKIQSGECLDYYPVHKNNVNQIKMIGEALGAAIQVSEGDDTWSFITIRTAIHGL